MARALGIEMLTLLGMPPVEYVELAAELGCKEVSTGLFSLDLGMFGIDEPLWPAWSLRDDPGLRREMKAAMADTGVQIGLGEGFGVGPDRPPAASLAALDLMAELGALRINAICMDDDFLASGAAADAMAELAELTRARGMRFTIEFFPPTGLNSLERALAVIDHVGRDKAQLLVDTMHLFRSGGTVEQVRSLPPGSIGYVQLSDGIVAPHDDAYFRTAMFGRSVPGAGDFPLEGLIAALEPEVTVSLEVPRLDDVRDDPCGHAERCVAAARALGA